MTEHDKGLGRAETNKSSAISGESAHFPNLIVSCQSSHHSLPVISSDFHQGITEQTLVSSLSFPVYSFTRSCHY